MEEFFDLEEMRTGSKVDVRRVRVATDDPKVIRECKDTYGNKG